MLAAAQKRDEKSHCQRNQPHEIREGGSSTPPAMPRPKERQRLGVARYNLRNESERAAGAVEILLQPVLMNNSR
jgi:hypothetical protein